MPTITPARVHDFYQSWGVCTHFYDTTDAPWGTLGTTAFISALNFIGCTLCRDILPFTNLGYSDANYKTIAQAGVKFIFGANPQNDPTHITVPNFIASLNQVLTDAPGCVAFVEGPNEVGTGTSFVYTSLAGATYANGLASLTAYMKDLYAQVKANSASAAIPVLMMTTLQGDNNSATTWQSTFNGGSTTNATGLCDRGNLHQYPGVFSLRSNFSNAIGQSGSNAIGYNTADGYITTTPIAITESGYTAPNWPAVPPFPGSSPFAYAVPEDVMAKYMPQNLLWAFANGFTPICIYDLFEDEAFWGQQDEHEGFFGLFKPDGTARLPATALNVLKTALSDTGATAATFTPTAQNITITGLPNAGNCAYLQKSAGDVVVCVWDDPLLWNPGSNAYFTPPSGTSVTVALGFTSPLVTITDTCTGTVSTQANASSVTVTVTDHVIVISAAVTAPAAPVYLKANNPATGIGPLTAVPAGSANGTLIGARPPGATGVRFYLPLGSSVTFTIAAAQPTSPPIAFTISGNGTGQYWEEALEGNISIYITATSNGAMFRWF